MGFSEDAILQWFSSYAYQPYLVYGAIIGFMVLSSFGFPVPEEVVLVSAGIVGYMGTRPDLFPPPFEGAATVDVYVLAAVCFFSVFLSDFLVYTLGRVLGDRLLESKIMARYKPRLDKVTRWVKEYGAYAAGIFRFTPGLRFPGHFSCGMLGLAQWKFITVDGLAALLTVPTQVLLVASFGEEIIVYFKQFKLVLLGLFAIGVVFWLWRRRRARAAV